MRNPTQLDRQFQDRFLKPFQAELDGMLDAREAKQSPIMEGLQALLAGTGATGVKVQGSRQIVIVSDLLQHSDALSFYRGDDWGSFRRSPDFARLAKNLDGVEVTIFWVPRPGAKVDSGRGGRLLGALPRGAGGGAGVRRAAGRPLMPAALFIFVTPDLARQPRQGGARRRFSCRRRGLLVDQVSRPRPVSGPPAGPSARCCSTLRRWCSSAGSASSPRPSATTATTSASS